MENEQQPVQYNQPPQIIKKGMSTGAAIVLGISLIIVAAIIAGAIIFASGTKTIRDLDLDSFDGFEIQVDENGEETTVNVNVNEPTEEPSNTKEYINSEYGFKFSYPDNFVIEFKNHAPLGEFDWLPLYFLIKNPELPKVAYDCCYTPEEVAENGIEPPITLSVLLPSPYPQNDLYDEAGQNLITDLMSLGLSREQALDTLDYVPQWKSGGPDIDPETTPSTIGCTEVEVTTIGGKPAVLGSGCLEGVVENTVAVINSLDGYYIKLKDDASEYSKRGWFDDIVNSFEF